MAKNKQKRIPGKKSRMSAEEIRALRNAYDEPLTAKNYIIFAAAPATLFGGILFYLTYVWWLGLIAAIIGVFYGLRIWLPKAVKRTYNIKSFNERNRLLNLLTQQMSDQTKIPKQVLERVVSRLDGELRQDFFPITARIANGATSSEINKMFNAVEEKYKDDIIFSQYLEQIETNFTTGIDNLSSLKDMNGYHNDIRKQRDLFLVFKSKRLKDCFSLIMLSLILISALQFGMGDHGTYIKAFASSMLGRGTSIVYTAIFIGLTRKFEKIYFDDNIMEVK